MNVHEFDFCTVQIEVSIVSNKHILSFTRNIPVQITRFEIVMYIHILVKYALHRKEIVYPIPNETFPIPAFYCDRPWYSLGNLFICENLVSWGLVLAVYRHAYADSRINVRPIHRFTDLFCNIGPPTYTVEI